MVIVSTVAYIIAQGTVNATPLLMSGMFSAPDLAKAQRARITAGDVAIKYAYTGANPTTAGHVLPANTTTEIVVTANITRLQFVQTSAASTVTITLEE